MGSTTQRRAPPREMPPSSPWKPSAGKAMASSSRQEAFDRAVRLADPVLRAFQYRAGGSGRRTHLHGDLARPFGEVHGGVEPSLKRDGHVFVFG